MSNFGYIFRNMPPVTKNLIIINAIIWLGSFLSASVSNILMRYGALHFFEAADFNAAQLVSYMFIHDPRNIFHLFFNMFTLLMFGITLEQVMGSKRFLLFYMVCGVGAGLIQELVWSFTLENTIVDGLARLNSVSVDYVRQWVAADPSILQNNYGFFTTVGASGAIYGILLAFAMLFPNRPLYFFFIPVPIKAKWMVLIWFVIELTLGTAEASDGVAHFAHLGGMIFGLLIILYWKKTGQIHGSDY